MLGCQGSWRDLDVTGRVRVNSGTDSLSESMGVESRAQEYTLIPGRRRRSRQDAQGWGSSPLCLQQRG